MQSSCGRQRVQVGSPSEIPLVSLLSTGELLLRAGLKRHQLYYLKRLHPGLIVPAQRLGMNWLWKEEMVAALVSLRSRMVR